MKLRLKGGRDAAGRYRHALLQRLISLLPSSWPAPRRKDGEEDGRRRWDIPSLLCTAVLMMLDDRKTLARAFRDALELMDEERAGRPLGRTYQGFVKCALQLGSRVWRKFLEGTQEAVRRAAGRHWKVDGWVPLAVDGTSLECPRTKANVERFGRSGKVENGPPQLLAVSLWHVVAELRWATRVGSCSASERVLMRRLMKEVPEDALLLMDAGFTGYELLSDLHARGVSFLVRVGANVRLMQGLKQGRRHGQAWLWPLSHRNRRPLELRLICTTDGKGNKVWLATNVLDGRRLRCKTALRLYQLRWGVEVMHRGLKQTLEGRRMRAMSPDCARLELEAMLLATTLLDIMGAEALKARRLPPRLRSMARCLDAVRWAMRRRPTMKTLRGMLAMTRDQRVRKGSRHSADWPRKKDHEPIGEPIFRLATPQEIAKAAKWLGN